MTAGVNQDETNISSSPNFGVSLRFPVLRFYKNQVIGKWTKRVLKRELLKDRNLAKEHPKRDAGRERNNCLTMIQKRYVIVADITMDASTNFMFSAVGYQHRTNSCGRYLA